MEESIVTAIIASLSSSGVLGLLGRLIIGKMNAEWKKLNETVEAINKGFQEMRTKMAVHEVVFEEAKRMKSDMEVMKREIIIMQQQVQAAWRELDNKKCS